MLKNKVGLLQFDDANEVCGRKSMSSIEVEEGPSILQGLILTRLFHCARMAGFESPFIFLLLSKLKEFTCYFCLFLLMLDELVSLLGLCFMYRISSYKTLP